MRVRIIFHAQNVLGFIKKQLEKNKMSENKYVREEKEKFLVETFKYY